MSLYGLCDVIFCFILRPKSSRYCRQPLLINLTAFLALSIIASGTVEKQCATLHMSNLYESINIYGRLDFGFTYGTVSIGFSVLLTVLEPLPPSLRAAYHVFGLLSFVQGLCTTIFTLTATSCVSQASECHSNALSFSLNVSKTCIIQHHVITRKSPVNE